MQRSLIKGNENGEIYSDALRWMPRKTIAICALDERGRDGQLAGAYTEENS